MGAPNPEFIPEAFAISAAPGFRNTIPAAPVTTQRASFDLGFPPLTMTPVVAGGKPMLGPDMNGILYMLSTHTVYQQTGQPYKYSADVAVAVGGYAPGTLLGSIDGMTVWLNLVNGNSDDPDSSGSLGWVPLYSYGATSIGGLVGGVRVLTPVEAAKTVIVLSGALIGNQQIVMPNHVQSWLIVNQCTGAFNVTVKTVAGVGVNVPAGGFASPTGVYSDSADVYLTFAPAALPIDVSPTANTISKRDNLGYLYTTTVPGAVDSTTRVATTAFVQAVGANAVAQALLQMVGSVIQSWVDVNGSRSINTNYLNSTGRPIQVSVCFSLSAFQDAQVAVNGIPVAFNQAGTSAEVLQACFIVPAGSIYRVNSTSGVFVQDAWSELR